MKFLHALLFFVILLAACTQPASDNTDPNANAMKAAQSEWTVMIYLNGDNNLEEFAIEDFLEMSSVGSTDSVNIVAQMDRIDGYDNGYGDWTGTLRFHIKKGMQPLKENAIGGYDEEADMGAGKTVADFVVWAREKYPAKKFMLVIWDHGAGWRKFSGLRANTAEATQAASIDDSSDKQILPSDLRLRSVEESPVKSVSHDSTSGRSLYNREIQDNLTETLGGQKLDVIGFDACLMGMVETGYAMRNVAKTMVASEELEPGPGWQHNDWAKLLADSPQTDAKSLGQKLVNSYQQQYATKSGTTFSAVNLERMDSLAISIDSLADALNAQLDSPGELAKIKNARAACKIYGGYPPGPGAYYNIDLKRFADLIGASTGDPTLRTAAEAVSQEITSLSVFGNYAHPTRQDGAGFGSHGIAIYFPPGRSLFNGDPLSTAYQDANDQYPVEFVKSHRWDNFLSSYVSHVP